MQATQTVLALVRVWKNYQFDKNWSGKAVLADALEDAGCKDKWLLKELRAFEPKGDPSIRCENFIVDPELHGIEIGYIIINFQNTEWKVRRSDLRVLWVSMPYYLVKVVPLTCLFYFMWNKGDKITQVMATRDPIEIINLRPPLPPSLLTYINEKILVCNPRSPKL